MKVVTSTPMLSVIIPVWDMTPQRADLTEKVVNRVWEVATIPTEVIVVDNGSAHRRNLKASARINWVANKGIAPAFNQGAMWAHGDTLCFLNSDCFVEPGWDKALFDCANTGNVIAFPWTKSAADTTWVKSDGVGITGWCFVVNHLTHEAVGDFDETFVPAFYEDTDYFYRHAKTGGVMWSVPVAHVTHTRGAERDLLFLANRIRFAWKHGLAVNQPPFFWTKPLPNWPPKE